jgi:endonuclease/exonuclease/phosphatase family metal-dependent hydrolase
MKLNVTTFNLRNEYRSVDGMNCFLNRTGIILENIRKEKPDIIGFQEAIPPIMDMLRAGLSEYTIIYSKRYDGIAHEGLAMAFRKDTTELFSLDCFWLSETPRTPGSRYAHASRYPRICQAAMVRLPETDQFVRVYNTHLDHLNEEGRISQIGQIFDYAYEREQELSTPWFVLGDLNAVPDSPSMAFCRNYEKMDVIDVTADLDYTFHGFGLEEKMKIDYIYVDKVTSEKPYTVKKWTDECNGILISDHYPVSIEVEL